MKQSSEIISIDPHDEDAQEAIEAADDVEWREFAITQVHHQQRIDRTLAELLPEFSRSYVQQLIQTGMVQSQGVTVTKPAQRVKVWDQIRVELRPTPQSQAFTPQVIPMEVVFEDADVLVINKQAGLVVHPAPGNWSGTLLNGLLAHDPIFRHMPRAGIVHRLDRDTSGLMVVAKNRTSMDMLVNAIAARTVSRQYLAIGMRTWSGAPNRTIDAAIGRDPRNRLRMAVVDLSQSAGKAARTDFSLLRNFEDACLVHCRLHTGRTHQIRVHMASIRHPLVGDANYGGSPMLGMTRQALHATHLAFAHPRTGQALAFDAPPPNDFSSLLDALGPGTGPKG